MACKDLGLSEEQLFDERDLQEASPTDISRSVSIHGEVTHTQLTCLCVYRRKSLNEKLKSVRSNNCVLMML